MKKKKSGNLAICGNRKRISAEKVPHGFSAARTECRCGRKQSFMDGHELELGNHRFYLQKYYQQQWCDNTMLYINVEDANCWYEHTRRVLSLRPYGSAKVSKPAEQNYGALVTFVGDPAGVLLHFAQLHKGRQ